MKKITSDSSIFIVIRTFLFLGITACSFENTSQELTRQEAQKDLAFMKSALEKYHAGYTRYTSADSMEHYFKKANEGISDISVLDLYKEVTSLVSKINCGHTRVSLPRNVNNKFIKSTVFLPFTVRFVGKQLFVFESLDHDVVRRGDEIRAINNMSIDQITTEIFEHHPSDGFIKDK